MGKSGRDWKEAQSNRENRRKQKGGWSKNKQEIKEKRKKDAA